MKFVDSCEVDVVAGKGGNGAVAFRREKFVPFGGPSGGDGGRGGDVVFVADEGLSTLLDLTYGRTLRADNGEQGHGKDCYGRAGADREVRVPVGTQVYNRESGDLLFDIDAATTRVVVARGGKGGRGNIHFATPYDRAPRRAEPGEPGEEIKLRLELKVMADVGLLGFPNVGKSTFIRAVSRAKPKVADYPFTTLTPHLGVARVGDEASYVIADIPGLIPGAAEGAGLGHRFLKHVERTRALLHLVTLDFADGRDPVDDYDALMKELAAFDPELAQRPQIVALTKIDVSEVREVYPALKTRFKKKGVELRAVSAVTGEGVRELSVELYKLAKEKTEVEDWETPRKAAPSAHAANGVHGTPARFAPTDADATATDDTKKTAPKPAKKTTAKTAAKKAAAKKASAKKGPAKTAAKKAAAKKASAEKATTKKVAAKRPARAATKKAAAKTTAKPTKKTSAKKATTKKVAAKRPAKAATKKAAAKPTKKTSAKKTKRPR